jgi:hypothetical protein
MVNPTNCTVEPAKNACLLNAPVPRPSRKLIAAARKAGLPDTTRSLRFMRHDFDKFGSAPCVFCPSNGSQPVAQAIQAVSDARKHLNQDTGAFYTLDVESDALIRIRPGQKPEVSVYDAFIMFAALGSYLHLNPTRYVEASILQPEIESVRTKVRDTLDAMETALLSVASRLSTQ